MTLTEIAGVLGIAKSSTTTICNSLEQAGLIERHGGGYSLGIRTAELGGAYLRSSDVVRDFYRLAPETITLSHELLQMGVLNGSGEVVCLARYEGRAPMRLSASPGDRFPASITALGNALLAQKTESELRKYYRDELDLPQWTAKSVSTVDALVEKIRRTRERGYAVDMGETHTTVCGIANVLSTRTIGGEPIAVGISLMRIPKRDEIVEWATYLAEFSRGFEHPMSTMSTDASEKTRPRLMSLR